jgi:hypothetical protein
VRQRYRRVSRQQATAFVVDVPFSEAVPKAQAYPKGAALRKRGGEKYSCSGGSFQRGALGMRLLSYLSKVRTAIKKLFRGLSISFIYK